jgi:TatD DNase family protein
VSRALPPLDLHAHVAADVPARTLEGFGAVVWAATRSQAEYEQVMSRSDLVTIWGVGCHPGVLAAQREFDETKFAALMEHTPLVSEIGLDGRSKVPMELQIQTFGAILKLLTERPRVTSVHSYGATAQVLGCLEEAGGVGGIVLHWWLGDDKETRRALALGCHFSVNQAMTTRPELLRAIPLDRLLVETDHPDGDRQSAKPRQPGAVQDVEAQIALLHGLPAAAVREHAWINLANLVRINEVTHLLPSPVQKMLAAVPAS